DLDLLIVSDAGRPAEILEPLGWVRHRRLPHRFLRGQDLIADVLAVNDTVLRAGVLELEPGIRMNLQGCDLALQHAAPLPLPGLDVEVEVASLGALVVLKAAAYTDRPHERSKDLGDLAL